MAEGLHNDGRWILDEICGGWALTLRPTAQLRPGLVHTFQSATNVPGSVYFFLHQDLSRSGGIVPEDGESVVVWLERFLSDPAGADNLAKLDASGADERHLFVWLTASGAAPFAVADLLVRDQAPVPTRAPTVPAAITDTWLCSTWDSGHGLRSQR